jgi:hypothetical protein
MQNYSISCTPVVIAGLYYPLYTISYCRTTLFVVHHELLQNSNVRSTSVDTAELKFPLHTSTY